MRLQTASAAISFAKKLEDESAKLYEDLSKRYTKDEDVWLSFAKENRKNVVQIERAYYGVITDAIEGCFAFDIEPAAYMFENTLVDNVSYADTLARAIEVEERIGRFYSEAAEQSKPLLADVPRVFVMIAKKRNDRVAKLRLL